jgi:uncharacterized protein
MAFRRENGHQTLVTGSRSMSRDVISLCSSAGLALLMAIGAPAVAQDGPSFNCAAATTAGEELVCSDAELAALDRRLQSRFEAAVAAAEARRPDALADLRAMQRGWVKGRDDCWKGSDFMGCVEFAYLHREAQLVAEWTLEEPTSVATYFCEGGSTVRASFFATELPSVRLERREDQDVAIELDPHSADASYVSDRGSSLRREGDGASIQWLAGPEEMCWLEPT